jgi:midasin
MEQFGLLNEGKIKENKRVYIQFLIFSDKQPIIRHQNFRLFGCMNPASDVGKRDIPIGIRNRLVFIY